MLQAGLVQSSRFVDNTVVLTHTMIIGGTGMLTDVSVSMAGQSRALTSIARTEDSLIALDSLLSEVGCDHHTIALDYNNNRALKEGISHAVAAAGPVDVVVGWFHDDDVALQLLATLVAIGRPFRFVQVMSSAAGDPAYNLAELRQQIESLGEITYQQVVLGFVSEDGQSRWLTNQEISDGVNSAIASSDPHVVVGTTRPWQARP